MISITKKCNTCKREKDSRLFSLYPHENICRVCLASIPNIRLPKSKHSMGHRDRYVYLISGIGLTKIGIADNVKTRLKNFRAGSPVELSLIYSFKINDALSVESFLHKKYADKRHHGEWFSLSDQDIESIRQEFCA